MKIKFLTAIALLCAVLGSCPGRESGNVERLKRLDDKSIEQDAQLAALPRQSAQYDSAQTTAQTAGRYSEAMAMAEGELKANNVDAARLCYLNAINHNPSGIHAYLELEKTYENASASELEGLYNVLLTARYRVEPSQLFTIQKLFERVEGRLRKMEREEADAEASLVQTWESKKPVDLCTVLNAPQPNYASAIKDQKAYMDAEQDESNVESGLLVLQNLILLQKVDDLISILEKSRSEFVQANKGTAAAIVNAAFDAALHPTLGEEVDTGIQALEKKLVGRQLTDCASYLDQLLHNNITSLSVDSPLARHLFNRMERIEIMAGIWQALNDAELIRHEGAALIHEAEQCDKIATIAAPGPVKIDEKGPLTEALIRLGHISKRMALLYGRLGSDMAREKCIQEFSGRLSAMEIRLAQKRSDAYNKWAIVSMMRSYNYYVLGGANEVYADGELTSKTLRSIDIALLNSNVAQLYQEYVAFLMKQVDGNGRARHRFGIPSAPKHSIERF